MYSCSTKTPICIHSRDFEDEKKCQKYSNKVSIYGEYLLFTGITTICFLREVPMHFYNQLKATGIGRYYSLLPPSSYHMTIINLVVEHNPEKLAQIVEHIKSQKYLLNVWLMQWMKDPISVPIRRSVYFRGTFGFHPILPSTMLHSLETLRVSFADVCKTKLDNVEMHVTLGYRYNNKEVPKEVCVAVEQVVERYMSLVMLCTPKICTFESMEHFEPI
jgi:hypothetical protein